MTQGEFFKRQASLTIGQIATLTGAEPLDGAPLDRVIKNVAPIDLAGPSDVTFIDSARYVKSLAETQAGACLMTPQFENSSPRGLIVLRSKEPYRAFVTVQREKRFPCWCVMSSLKTLIMPRVIADCASKKALCSPLTT